MTTFELDTTVPILATMRVLENRRKFAMNNHGINIIEVAKIVGISVGLCHAILTFSLSFGMVCKAAWLVLKYILEQN